MRTDLESAMAAVITGPAAHRRFVEDPQAFARDFDLASGEVDALLAMKGDLASLTTSFVAKRSMTVRWNARRTIAMLGPRGVALVEEYFDTYPLVESFSEEADRFSDFVVARTRAMVDDTFRSVVIAEMARYERLRSLAFWGAKSISQSRHSRPVGHRSGTCANMETAGGGEIQLTPGAQVDAFGWDMRIFHRCRVFPLRVLHDDPCDLLAFHNGRENGLRVHRLRPDEFALVRCLQESGPLPADESVAGPSGEVGVVDVGAPLLASGVITWA